MLEASTIHFGGLGEGLQPPLDPTLIIAKEGSSLVEVSEKTKDNSFKCNLPEWYQKKRRKRAKVRFPHHKVGTQYGQLPQTGSKQHHKILKDKTFVLNIPYLLGLYL